VPVIVPETGIMWEARLSLQVRILMRLGMPGSLTPEVYAYRVLTASCSFVASDDAAYASVTTSI
jgi:hypothetical protein